jgi:ribonuclease P protein component
VRTKGAIFEGTFLKFYHLCRGDQQLPFLVAVNVHKRFGAAARRNRVKRRIRESLLMSLREHREVLNTHRINFSVVIVYKGARDKPLERVTFADVHRDVGMFMHTIITHGSIAE